MAHAGRLQYESLVAVREEKAVLVTPLVVALGTRAALAVRLEQLAADARRVGRGGAALERQSQQVHA